MGRKSKIMGIHFIPMDCSRVIADIFIEKIKNLPICVVYFKKTLDLAYTLTKYLIKNKKKIKTLSLLYFTNF